MLFIDSRLNILFYALVLLISANNAWAQGHGVCNNSAGFRMLKQTLMEDSKLQELARKLEQEESKLSTSDQVHLKIKYNDLLKNEAKRLFETKAKDLKLLSMGKGSQAYSQQQALAMDFRMSRGFPADVCEDVSVKWQDISIDWSAERQVDPRGLEMRSLSEMVQAEYPDIRVNGEAIPNAAEEVMGASHFDQQSIEEMMHFLSENLAEEQLATLQHTTSAEQAAGVLSEMKSGDSALMSYDVRYRLQNDTLSSTRRYTDFVFATNDNELLVYQPMSLKYTRYPSISTFDSYVIDKTLEPFLKIDLLEICTDYINDIGNTFNRGSVNETQIRINLLENEFGVETDGSWVVGLEMDPLVDAELSNFTVISHQPLPPLDPRPKWRKLDERHISTYRNFFLSNN